MTRMIILFLITFIFLNSSHAQELFKRDSYCSYSGNNGSTVDIYTFNPDEAANRAVDKILKYTGLNKNFIIKAANVNNAEASIQGNTRFVLYSQEFMIRIKQITNTDWAAVSIMAHEIGHHLQGHTLLSGGSRPSIELEADKYSGFILQKMGATLEQALAAMKAIPNENGTETHPGKQARLAAITNGWIEARDLTSPPEPNKKPSSTISKQPEITINQPINPQPTVPVVPKVFYVSRCVFAMDQTAYFVTNTNDIVVINTFGQAVIAGKKIPSNYPDFAWMYQAPNAIYGVSFQGEIFGSLPNGQQIKVGYVTNPN